MARTVLVADDSRIIRQTLCRIFEAEENYDICAEATNGQEAIELALKHRPELIILDFSMPVIESDQNFCRAGRRVFCMRYLGKQDSKLIAALPAYGIRTAHTREQSF